jgi:hypothetical protein
MRSWGPRPRHSPSTECPDPDIQRLHPDSPLLHSWYKIRPPAALRRGCNLSNEQAASIGKGGCSSIRGFDETQKGLREPLQRHLGHTGV